MHTQENQEIQEIEEFALEYLFRVLALSFKALVCFHFCHLSLIQKINHAVLILRFLHMRCLLSCC